MDDAQQFSVIAGVIILLACGVAYRGRRGRSLSPRRPSERLSARSLSPGYSAS